MAGPAQSIGLRLGASFDELYPTDYNPLSWTFCTTLHIDVAHLWSGSNSQMRAVTLLNYFTRLIDSVVSIFVLAYLEGQKHFLGMREDYREGRTKTLFVKVVLTPITMPLRIFGAVLVFGPFIALRMAVNVLGIGTILDVRDITNRGTESRDNYRRNTFIDDFLRSVNTVDTNYSYSNQRACRQYHERGKEQVFTENESNLRSDLNILERYGYNAGMMFLQVIHT